MLFLELDFYILQSVDVFNFFVSSLTHVARIHTELLLIGVFPPI